MKINRLHIENFRNHKKTLISLDQINFFAGHNNAGKSSILAAIEWGLTGRCMWTDKAGRGASELIRQGEKLAIVALEVEELGTVVRSLPPHTLQVDRISGVNEGQAAIQNYLQADENRLQVALNANAFLSMSQSEQRSFLFAAYGLSWTVDQVVSELVHWLARERFKDGEALRLAAKAKRYYPAGITDGPEIFEAMEKRARDERKELKKDKQQAEAALAEISLGSINHELPEGLEDSQNQLAELKKRRDELLKACGASREAQFRRQALLEKIEHTDEQIADALTKTDSLVNELAGLRGPFDDQSGPGDLDGPDGMDSLGNPNGLGDSVATDKYTDKYTDTEAAAAKIEQALQKEIDAANKAAAAARSKLDAINKAGQALSSGERRCPLAPELLPCSLTQDQLDAVLSSLRSDYKITSQELEHEEAVISNTTAKLAAVKTSLEESRTRSKRLLFLQSELNIHSLLAASLESSLSDMKKELASLPDGDQSLLEDLAQLETAILQIETALAQYKEVQALAARHASLQRDAETLASGVADLEVLVKALGPDGLRKDLLGGILTGFVGRVNDRLGRLTEGTYHISLAPDMTMLCRAGGGPLLPFKLLSKSEQLRVGIAISEVLSAAVGIRFLAIDEADMLDQENRDLLTGMLLDTADEFDQVLVFTTIGDVRPANPNLPGVKMFWVEYGTVQEL